MQRTRHTWLFEPGLWVATGHFWEGGRVERDGRGTSLVRHTDTEWEIEGEMEILGDAPVRFQNRYRIEPPRSPGDIIRWRSNNPAVGSLIGVFAVAGETILSFFQSENKEQGGSETLTQLAPSRYRASGIFLSSGAVVSTWSMELVRQA
jgi:hypothetical protein